MPVFRNGLLPVMMAGLFALTACQSNMATEDANENMPMTDANIAQSDVHITADQLASHTWTLVSARDDNNQKLEAFAKLAKENQPTLNFVDGRLSASVGCNQLNVDYELEYNVLQTADNMLATKMMCAPAVMKAENKLATLLVGSSQLELKEGDLPVLTQIHESGTTLVWHGEMTNVAKYGNATTVFWEVKPKVQPCPDGTTRACLKVRPVNYDDKGIKQSVGKWILFDGEIDGYTHDERHRNVLRLERYTVDANTKQYAYVLDTVIESALVKK